MAEGLVDTSGGYYRLRGLWLRRYLDLAFASLWRDVSRSIRRAHFVAPRRILDIGARTADYQKIFPGAAYQTLDPNYPSDFSSLAEFSKHTGPSPDLYLLLEVLEHVDDPENFLTELHTLMSARSWDAELWLSVPFNARTHASPDDYHRWTRQGLVQLLTASGFVIEELKERSTNFVSWVAQTNVYFFQVLGTRFFWAGVFYALGFWWWLHLLAYLSVRRGGAFSDIAQPTNPLGFYAILKVRR